MTISFMPYRHHPSQAIWAWPDAARQDPEAFEFNLSNANAADLLLALGLDPDGDSDPMPIDAFSGLVTAALRRHLGQRSPALERLVDAAEGRATLIYCGRREGYLEEKLGELARFIQRCRAADATHISWG